MAKAKKPAGAKPAPRPKGIDGKFLGRSQTAIVPRGNAVRALAPGAGRAVATRGGRAIVPVGPKKGSASTALASTDPGGGRGGRTGKAQKRLKGPKAPRKAKGAQSASGPKKPRAKSTKAGPVRVKATVLRQTPNRPVAGLLASKVRSG